jgi:hypothetical protein
MPRKPPKVPSPEVIRIAMGAMLTISRLGKMVLEGKRADHRMCPRCTYKMVEPAGRRRRKSRGKDAWHLWRCSACRSRYVSDGVGGPFRADSQSPPDKPRRS